MAFDYAGSAETALRLIKNFGQKVELTRITRVTDIVEGAAVETSREVGLLDAVTVPASKGTVAAFDERTLDDMRKGKLRFFIAAASTAPFSPLPNDYIEFEDRIWIINGSTPLNPNGTPVIYKFGVRLTSDSLLHTMPNFDWEFAPDDTPSFEFAPDDIAILEFI